MPMDRTYLKITLGESAEIFRDAASFYVTDNRAAIKARRKVNKDGPDPFHACLLSHLTLLCNLLDHVSIDARLQCADVRGTVLETLRLLDSLVIDAPPHSSDRQYHGLRHLVRRYEADQTETRMPKPLGYRAYLFCPPLAHRLRLKAQLQACCEALDRDPSKAPDTLSIQSEIDEVEEWKLAPGLTRHPARLQSLLRTYSDCACRHSHEDMKVGFVGHSRLSPSHDSDAALYRICFPAQVESSLWRATNLELLQKGNTFGPSKVESQCGSAQVLGNISEGEWHTVETFCEAFSNNQIPYSLRLTESGLEIRGGSRVGDSRLTSLISLRASLDSDAQEFMQRIGRKDRVVLGVILCYIYLHLSGTSWWTYDNVRPDFWFSQINSAPALFDIRQPFLSFGTRDLGTKGVLAQCLNPNRPSLPALGKLLLEIWNGSEVDWSDVDATVERCRQDDTGEYWLCAIEACLGADEDLKAKGSLQEEDAIRSMFVRKVVKSLQWLLEKVCRLSVEDAFASVSERSHVVKGVTKSLPTHKRTHDDIDPELAKKKVCLHDDGQRWELASGTQ